MAIRAATHEDIPSMIALADTKRTEYAGYAPTFWRKAAEGVAKQTTFFGSLLTHPNVLALVNEERGVVDGFVIASVIDAPPVYDPGSRVCMVDDFTVANPDIWATTGHALLHTVRELAKSHDAQLTVVVCGHLDAPKRAMLQASGFGLASEWYVNPL